MLQIITDSASDISQSVAGEWGVTVLPLTVSFGDEEYEDGVTITPSGFYTKLVETDVLPKTSQITPSRYEEAFRRARERGDEVVAVCLSSELSGSYQSACAAAAEFDGGIEVVDSRVVCCGLYILVELAVRLRSQGMNAAQVAAVLRGKVQEVSVIALFDTLEYLRMGGRIGATAAFAGGILSIKPVLTIREGRIVAIGKARGSRNGNNMLMEYVKKQGGIDFTLPICVAWSGNSDELVRKYIEDSRSLYDGFEGEIPTTRVGSTIGTYAGPGAVALAFFPKH